MQKNEIKKMQNQPRSAYSGGRRPQRGGRYIASTKYLASSGHQDYLKLRKKKMCFDFEVNKYKKKNQMIQESLFDSTNANGPVMNANQIE